MNIGTVVAKDVRPRERVYWRGYEVECERQARRTTFFRLTSPELDGCRIQLKRTAILTRSGRGA